MNSRLDSFLKESPIAAQVTLPTKVIVHRTRLNPRDLVAIAAEKQYGPIPEKEELCEIEAGGRVLAKGKIVKRKGEFYFKIMETFSEMKKEDENETGRH